MIIIILLFKITLKMLNLFYFSCYFRLPVDTAAVVAVIAAAMLVPPDMMAAQTRMIYQMNRYCAERVQARMFKTATSIREICKIVQDILKEVELQEPRFISSLVECNGR